MKRILILSSFLMVLIGLPLPALSFGVEGWFEKGLYLLKSQYYGDAISAFSKAIEEDPDDHLAYNNRGLAWFHKGNYDQAISDFTMALEANPRYEMAYNNRGLAWLRKGQYDQAIADYTQALDTNPLSSEAHNQLAWILATCPDERFRNGPRALELAKKAVELKPEFYFLDTLAAAQAEVGEFGDAIESQQQVIKMLKEGGHTENPGEYMERLESYRGDKPWRIKRNTPQGRMGNENTSKGTPAKADQKRGQSGYPFTIQVGSCRVKENSDRLAGALLKEGKTAFTSHASIPGKGDWHRVYVGIYRTIEEAHEAAIELKTARFPHAFFVERPYAIQISPSNGLKKTEELRAKLNKYGYLAYRIPDPRDDQKDSLFVGAFKKEEEAKRLIEKLKGEGFEPKLVLR